MFTVETIAYPLLLILALTLVHMVIWRYLDIKKQIFCLFFIFLGLPLCAEMLALGLFPDHFYSFENFASTVLYSSLAVMYLQMFPAIQARSPSLLIMTLPGLSEQGLEKPDIVTALQNVSMLDDRLDDLINDGFAYRNGQSLSLKWPGTCLAWFFYHYRQILGLPQGKG